jgi:hypothetical protein
VKRFSLVLALLALAGCAREQEEDLPAACTRPDTLRAALHSAPEPVRVEGAPLSDCLTRDASAGDVQTVGFAFLETAQRLGEEEDAVALGYLVGALRPRAEKTQGIHLETVRRLEQEAEPFRRTPGFERGLRAGRTSG